MESGRAPGGQIDHSVNPGLVPGSITYGNTVGPTAPTFRYNEEAFYVNNFHLGIEFHF